MASSPPPPLLSISTALLFSCFFLPSSSALPLCTDLRAPVTPNRPLSFCSYNGTCCCNATDDSNLQKQFSSMNISDASCASLIKSLLCTRCDPFSAELYTVESKTRTVPVLCKGGFCEQIWDTCKDVPIQNSPFAASLKGTDGGGGAQLATSPASNLTDLWQSKTDFCRSFGGKTNRSVCFDGESVVFNSSTQIPPSPKGLCLERLWDGAYLNMVAHPDGSDRVFLGNQAGKIWLATIPEHGSGEKLGLDESEPFLDLTDLVHLDTKYGMMGMAFHPDFTSNGRFFASFNCDKTLQPNCNGRCSCNSEIGCDPSKLGDDGGVHPCQYQSVIAEFTANSSSATTTASPGEVRRILTMGLPYASEHGGQILFGPSDGYLYLMMGDGDNAADPMNFAQNKKSLLGKIIRLDVDTMPSSKEIDDLGLWGNYSIPGDNPYKEDGELGPEIWALGFRNPWRCSFDSGRPDYFFCADVGQNTYEEVDLVTKGGNYGWNAYEGPDPFVPRSSSTKPNTTATNITLAAGDAAIPPIMGYKHIAQSASITGGYVCRSQTDPCMFGRYLFADLYAIEIWTGTEHPEDSGNYNKTLIPFACSNDQLPMPCDSVMGSSLPSLGYIYSFGEDNNKDVFILASKGVYRVVRPSRCGYTCPIEQDVETTTGNGGNTTSSPASSCSKPQLGNLMFVVIIVYSLLLYAIL